MDWQPLVKRTGNGFLQSHMTIAKNHVGFLCVTKMAVGLVDCARLIRLQIQIIPLLELWIARRRSSLKGVHLRGVGEGRSFCRLSDATDVYRRLVGWDE